MPRIAIDYSKSCVYKLVSNDPTIKDCYVGSTTNMIKRKTQHKSDCCNPNSSNYNHYVYQFIRANGTWANWSMVLIEKVVVKSSSELIQHERRHFELLKPTLNKQIPNRTHAESMKAYNDVHK